MASPSSELRSSVVHLIVALNIFLPLTAGDTVDICSDGERYSGRAGKINISSPGYPGFEEGRNGTCSCYITTVPKTVGTIQIEPLEISYPSCLTCRPRCWASIDVWSSADASSSKTFCLPNDAKNFTRYTATSVYLVNITYRSSKIKPSGYQRYEGNFLISVSALNSNSIVLQCGTHSSTTATTRAPYLSKSTIPRVRTTRIRSRSTTTRSTASSTTTSSTASSATSSASVSSTISSTGKISTTSTLPWPTNSSTTSVNTTASSTISSRPTEIWSTNVTSTTSISNSERSSTTLIIGTTRSSTGSSSVSSSTPKDEVEVTSTVIDKVNTNTATEDINGSVTMIPVAQNYGDVVVIVIVVVLLILLFAAIIAVLLICRCRKRKTANVTNHPMPSKLKEKGLRYVPMMMMGTYLDPIEVQKQNEFDYDNGYESLDKYKYASIPDQPEKQNVYDVPRNQGDLGGDGNRKNGKNMPGLERQTSNYAPMDQKIQKKISETNLSPSIYADIEAIRSFNGHSSSLEGASFPATVKSEDDQVYYNSVQKKPTAQPQRRSEIIGYETCYSPDVKDTANLVVTSSNSAPGLELYSTAEEQHHPNRSGNYSFIRCEDDGDKLENELEYCNVGARKGGSSKTKSGEEELLLVENDFYNESREDAANK